MTARAEYIDGLRQLADFLAANPELPATRDHYITGDDDERGIAEVKRFAALLGVEAKRNGNHDWSASRRFGGVTYSVTYVLRERMVEWHALTSYGENFRAAEVTA